MAFRPELHEAGLFELSLEHGCKFEEPEVVSGYFPLHLQHSAIHHHYLPDRYLSPCALAIKVFVGISWQFRNHHDSHSAGIARDGELALPIIDLSILTELAKLKAVSFSLAHSFNVGIHHILTIFYQLISKLEVHKAVAQLYLCKDKFQLLAGTHLSYDWLYCLLAFSRREGHIYA